MKFIVILIATLFFGLSTRVYSQEETNTIDVAVKAGDIPKVKDTARIALLKTKAESCMNNIIRLNFAAAAEFFDPRFKEDFSPDTLKKFWNYFKDEAGSIVEQTGIKDAANDTAQGIIITYLCRKGHWDFHVVFTNANQINGLYVEKTPPPVIKAYHFPDYVVGDSVRETDIMVGKGEWAVPGHITLPAFPGKYPAVVLVPGAGPMDRDESLFANKPFKDLAWGLASRGFAVLRFDKRTKFHSKKIVKDRPVLTTDFEVTQDVLSAIKVLQSFREVRRDQIFVLGHGLGGMLAPKIAKLDTTVAGLIILAGNARPLEDLIVEEVEYVYSLDGIINEDRAKIIKKLKRMVQNVKSPILSITTPADSLPLQVPAEYWLGLKGYNPTQTALKINKPILVLQGERDYEVTMEDFELWKKTLKPVPLCEFKSYPNLNHIFVTGKGKARPDEYRIANHVEKVVVEDIARWMKEKIKK
ncbi:MAG: dienelactone hydrolase family protein [Ignavibacteriae bacterium]|nr:dienelactone hydrolase family protein [Ignavibacteriota bacterium]